MSLDIPPAPPEAEVIRLARLAADMSAQDAAEASRAHDGRGVSAAYWRDVERGYGGRRGQRVPTRASARALAAMARVVGVEPPQLAVVGREDAARVLEEILRREQAATSPEPEPEIPATADGAVAVASAGIIALLPPLERRVWEEIQRHPEGTPAEVIFTDPLERALWGRVLTPERQRIREIAAWRSVQSRPTRPAARRAG